MLSRFKLGTQFTLIMLVVFIVGIVASGVVLWRVLEQQAEAEVTERSLVLLETMNAVRAYTSGHVNPLLAPELEIQTEFIPETVPAFSAREVFENVRSNAAYGDFLYKEATLNPTNPRDLADPFETTLINAFRANFNNTELSGFREVDGELLYYNARPLAISNESCLRCHSDTAVAPESLLTTYGDTGGFGWELGEIVAAQVIYVPATDVFNSAQQSLAVMLAIFTVAFAVVVMLTNFLLKRTVITPVTQIGDLAQKIRDERVTWQDIEESNVAAIATRTDEVGESAKAFQHMAKEVQAREERLRARVAELEIKVDEQKQQKQVQAITESAYFKDLKAKVQDLKSRKQDS